MDSMAVSMGIMGMGCVALCNYSSSLTFLVRDHLVTEKREGGTKSVRETNKVKKKARTKSATGRKEFLPRNSLFYKSYKHVKQGKDGFV